MGFKMVLSCVVLLVVLARLSSAVAGIKGRPAIRRGSVSLRRNRVNTHLKNRARCSEHAPPTYRRLANLWNKLRFHLAVLANGTVHGVNNTYCKQTMRCLFELQSCGTSVIRIKNVKSGLYIAISKAGKVYTTMRSHKPDTLLLQKLLPNGFTVFWSERKRKHFMHLALKRSGAMKNALKTARRHKSVHFTVILCSKRRKDHDLSHYPATC